MNTQVKTALIAFLMMKVLVAFAAGYWLAHRRHAVATPQASSQCR